MHTDPTIPARFEKMHIELAVTLSDGRTFHTRCNGPRGIWGGEPVSPAPSGVSEGEEVAVDGQLRLNNGTKVEIKKL